ncbi:f-box domain [Lecanosticta acicola]|uniref:F-box domain n=1 Tax=Lecanosticta acicola TaxID=111012 RepID=A0AAI8Z0Y7_9PEZI|nr:f-box domain [Lecanosticta acicola]
MSDITGLLASLSEAERTNAFRALAQHLNKSERISLSAMLSERDDFVAILPSELTANILSHLPPTSAWVLQVVCKRWQKVLSSDDNQRAALRQWATHHPADSASIPLPDESIEIRIQHYQAMRLGKPFSTYTVQDSTLVRPEHHGDRFQPPSPSLSQEGRTFALKGKRLAYIASSGSKVVVHDLVSDDIHSFRDEARHSIHGLTLTSSAIAFTTFTGKLYTKDLISHESQLRRVKLPSSSVHAFNGDGAFIVLILLANSDAFTMLIYDTTTGETWSHDLPLLFPRPSRRYSIVERAASTSPPESEDEYPFIWSMPHAILVDSETKSVDIFQQPQREIKSNMPIAVGHRRVNFSGEVVTSSLAVVEDSEGMRLLDRLGDLHPTGKNGEYVFRSKIVTLGPNDHFVFAFQSEEAALTIHPVLDSKGLGATTECVPYDWGLSYSSHAVWKDVELFAHYGGQIHFCTKHTEGCKHNKGCKSGTEFYRRRGSLDIRDATRASDVPIRQGHGFSIAVNDTFLVAMQQSDERQMMENHNIVVFCFNPALEWVGTRQQNA